MRVIYDIPKSPERSLPLPSIAGRAEGGDIDLGPEVWVEYLAVFPEEVDAQTAVKNTGDYLARNYEDDFRQAVIDMPAGTLIAGNTTHWIVKVYLAWGDGHYTRISA